MSKINGIITEAITRVILNNYINKIQKYVHDLETMNTSQYGNEIYNFSEKLKRISYYILNTSAKSSNPITNSIKKYRGGHFNPYLVSRGLSKYGIKIPNEGLTDNVYNNSVKAYNWSQDKMNKLSGNDNNQVNNKDAVANAQAVQIKKIMASMWPQLFSEYANLVARYRYVLQKLPTVTSLVKTLDELYGSLK
jgi:hypothetical protein